MKKFNPYNCMDCFVYHTRYLAEKRCCFGHKHIVYVTFCDSYGHILDGYMNMTEKEYDEYKMWRKENK